MRVNYLWVKLLGHSAQQYTHTHNRFTPFFWDHPGEPVPEENFWTSWCKGRLMEADTLTIWVGATPSGLTSAHLHHLPIFFYGQMPFLPPNQQHRSTEGNQLVQFYSNNATNLHHLTSHSMPCCHFTLCI